MHLSAHHPPLPPSLPLCTLAWPKVWSGFLTSVEPLVGKPRKSEVDTEWTKLQEDKSRLEKELKKLKKRGVPTMEREKLSGVVQRLVQRERQVEVLSKELEKMAQKHGEYLSPKILTPGTEPFQWMDKDQYSNEGEEEGGEDMTGKKGKKLLLTEGSGGIVVDTKWSALMDEMGEVRERVSSFLV